jgi:putative transcriptional regulator
MRLMGVLLAFVVLFAGPAPAQEPAPSLKGKFLVADPSMPDARFAGTVIYMIAHAKKDGAVGIVVNRPGQTRTAGEIMRAFGLDPGNGKGAETAIPLFWGGPVQNDHAFFLHSDEFKVASTIAVAPGVALSQPEEMLEAIAAGRVPKHMLMAVGYAGWSPGQLESELEMKGWAVVVAGAELLFDGDAAGKWARAWRMRTHDL